MDALRDVKKKNKQFIPQIGKSFAQHRIIFQVIKRKKRVIVTSVKQEFQFRVEKSYAPTDSVTSTCNARER
jgi:hypothetical protein